MMSENRGHWPCRCDSNKVLMSRTLRLINNSDELASASYILLYVPLRMRFFEHKPIVSQTWIVKPHLKFQFCWFLSVYASSGLELGSLGFGWGILVQTGDGDGDGLNSS